MRQSLQHPCWPKVFLMHNICVCPVPVHGNAVLWLPGALCLPQWTELGNWSGLKKHLPHPSPPPLFLKLDQFPSLILVLIKLMGNQKTGGRGVKRWVSKEYLILLLWTLSYETAQPEPCSIRHHTGKGHPKPFSLVESLLQHKWALGGMSGSSREDAVDARERMKELSEEELL